MKSTGKKTYLAYTPSLLYPHFHCLSLVLFPLLSDPLLQPLCWCAQAAITKAHGVSGLNSRSLFSHNSGGRQSQIKVSTWSVPSEVALLSLQMVTFSL